MFEFFDQISQWITTGIYDFVVEATAWALSTFTLAWFKLQLTSLKFAWEIAQGVISNLGISSMLQGAWASLPADVSSAASFFRVPEALNILISGGVTRMVMSFIPGL